MQSAAAQQLPHQQYRPRLQVIDGGMTPARPVHAPEVEAAFAFGRIGSADLRLLASEIEWIGTPGLPGEERHVAREALISWAMAHVEARSQQGLRTRLRIALLGLAEDAAQAEAQGERPTIVLTQACEGQLGSDEAEVAFQLAVILGIFEDVASEHAPTQ